MTIDVAPVTFRAFVLQRGQRTDTIQGRQYRVSTDHKGRTVIGPARHRKMSSEPKAREVDPAAVTAAFSRIRTPWPAPPPQKPSRWQRVKDRVAAAWDLFTDPDWHRLVQHVAVDVLVWALAIGVVGLVSRALYWAWS